MDGHIILLGTVHELTGAKKLPGAIDDPIYREIVQSILKNDTVDFVFEEIGGRGPTFAEERALQILGPGRYLDVDPSAECREQRGVPRECSSSFAWNPMSAAEVKDYLWEFKIEAHTRREAIWLEEIQKTQFNRALFVCGHAHMFSMAFKLGACGFSAEAKAHLPFHRLCTRKHAMPM